VEDPLTGAANRRRFDELLNMEVSRGSRDATPVSLIMIDIDRFKAVNDFYGHQTGDSCLIQVVQALRKSVARCTDVIARYGGEEFAVILPNTGAEPATAIAEKMRRVVEELEIPNAASQFNQRLSISLGVGTLMPGSTYNADFLVGMADRALYEAKQNGRNQVVVAGAPELAL
jgi:diguanylate cyclase (GGDEF)-like protein